MNKSEKQFRKIFIDLMSNGLSCKPRGMKILEIEDYSYILTPYVRFCNFESRKLSLNYIKQEFKWYLKGNMYDISISNFASMWKGLISEKGVINSNYGQYIFAHGDFYRTANELLKDKDSRRASITILNYLHLNEENVKDVPCTYALNFRIRNNKLRMSVLMRSQDCYFGMGTDAPCFSFIHEMMFVYLKDFYPELEYGYYFHYCNSFHIYEKHFEILKKISKENDKFKEIDCPKISCKDEVDFLIKYDFSNIPDKFGFAKWLNS